MVYAPIGPPEGTPDANAIYVDIAPGTGTEAIAAQLEQRRRHPQPLRLRPPPRLQRRHAQSRRVPLQPPRPRHRGLRPHRPRRRLHHRPHHPRGLQHLRHRPGGRSAGLGSRDTFLAAERSQTALIADLSPSAPSLEGYLFPDTYRFPRHTTPPQMLAAMVQRFRQVAAPARPRDPPTPAHARSSSPRSSKRRSARTPNAPS